MQIQGRPNQQPSSKKSLACLTTQTKQSKQHEWRNSAAWRELTFKSNNNETSSEFLKRKHLLSAVRIFHWQDFGNIA
jgi:hypothetical protein